MIKLTLCSYSELSKTEKIIIGQFVYGNKHRRVFEFKNGTQYAVVTNFGWIGRLEKYTTHRSINAAKKRYLKLLKQEKNPYFIDYKGFLYFYDCDDESMIRTELCLIGEFEKC